MSKVIDVDRVTRIVTMQREDGTEFSVLAGPEVRNFDRISVDDTVEARYVETFYARRLAPDEAGPELAAEVAAARAEPGEKPAGGLAAGVEMTVRIESVDLEQHLVTFTDPAGELRVIRAQRDEGKAFIRGLQHGDRVELIYTESVMLSVD
jgi:hypothetical protein